MAESITVSARSLFTQGGSVSWHQYSKVYEVDRERRGVSVCVSPSSMYACGKRAAFDIFCVCVLDLCLSVIFQVYFGPF